MSTAILQSADVAERHYKWPDDPYKGLTYYGRDDVPLFAGRAIDVQRVAHILASGSTRILLLHGSTGCGKSSLLRAGLIPFLENQIGRFNFAKELKSGDTALLVRSTHDPLLELAIRAYGVAVAIINSQGSDASERAHSDETSAAPSRSTSSLRHESTEELERFANEPIIDLEKYPTLAKFTKAVAKDPERLVDLIGRIAYFRPRTQALVIDQAEEVLILKPGPEGEAARRQFFMFLVYLSLSSINFRLIVAFRTEYHGRFYALLKGSGADSVSLEDYYLGDLTGRDLLDAIKRPCSTDEIPGYGVPRDHYQFTYEEDLPELIVRDLKRMLTSGMLPALQIVCRRLYHKAKTTGKVHGLWIIRRKDYGELGGIQGQIDLHLQEALEQCCQTFGNFGYKLFESKFESMRWRDVLSALAKPQSDGSITTDVKLASALSELAENRGCRMTFEEVMTFLAREEWKIVRPVELTKVATNEKVQCYSLGHDVLGGVLERWRLGRQKDRTGIKKALIIWGVLISISSLYLMFQFSRMQVGWFIGIAGIVLGISLGLLAAIPDTKRFSVLNRSIYGFFSNLRGLQRLGNVGAIERELAQAQAHRF